MPTSFRCRGFAFALAASLQALATAGPASTVSSPAVEQAAAKIAQALEAVHKTPGSFPAYAAVFVHGAADRWIYVQGQARQDCPAPANADTLFYIASQTKSFMGLLAAILDRKGVLPLDTTLAQVWPGLSLPAPADPARITMADLLSHQEGLRTDTLNIVTPTCATFPPPNIRACWQAKPARAIPASATPTWVI